MIRVLALKLNGIKYSSVISNNITLNFNSKEVNITFFLGDKYKTIHK